MKHFYHRNGKVISHIILSIAIAGSFFSCQSRDNAKTVSTPAAQRFAKQQAASPVPAASVDTTSQKVIPAQNVRKLVVYYLHGTYRCPSCNKIERLTKEAVEQGFAEQIRKGRVEMKILNVEEKGNEHFVDDYKLYTKSVILSDLKDGKEASWKNLDQVWTLLGNEAKFVEYIQKEVKTFLEG
jgi:hypothetical protein